MARATPAASSIFRFPATRRDRLFRFPRSRRDQTLLKAIRASFGPLSAWAPGLSARWAELLFRTPPRYPRLPSEARALADGDFAWVPFRNGRLASWTFGSGPPILLVHGWGGHAGRFSRFFRPLAAAGFSVISFDAPGHGDSTGATSSLPDFVASIEAFARERGPLAGILGHSMGAAAATLALRRGTTPERTVLLAPPIDPEIYAARFAHYMKIPPAIRDGMKRRLISRYGLTWDDLRLIRPDPPSAAMLIVHDQRDCRVPWKEGAALAASWPGALLITTCGLGHHKILRDRDVVGAAVRFLARLPEVSRRRRARA